MKNIASSNSNKGKDNKPKKKKNRRNIYINMLYVISLNVKACFSCSMVFNMNAFME